MSGVRVRIADGTMQHFVDDPERTWGSRFYKHRVSDNGTLTVYMTVHSQCLGEMVTDIHSWAGDEWYEAEKLA